MAYKHPPKEPIAIIGSGCRFPGDSTSPSKLWELLRSPRDLTKTVPSESRFNADGFYHPNGERHGAINVTKSYFIEEDPRLFDCGFFSIAPREAEAIDPQQRLLLEVVYEAMENAGLTLQGLKGSQTSAYVGAMSADYTDTQTRDVENMSQYMITGTSRALLSNRLSYFFDWHGPSISVDTACSSSLAAVHLGVQSLRNGECTTSCVAGSNLILGPDAYLAATSLHLLSPSGWSQMWDQAADGYARGEGICAIFMKTLSQALRDGDRIDALIRETCINSDGRTVGIALPSAEAQAALISTAYKNAGLDILRAEDRPQYIEAHGTGTQAGDPREASALSQTFFPPGHEFDRTPSMPVGSIKTIIGHTEGTMRHGTIPPNQHLHHLNPSVKPFYDKLQISTSPQEWPSVPPNHPLRASINGFGSGGTNCHAIMESYVPEIHDTGPWGMPEALSVARAAVLPIADFVPTPLIFSASSASALVAMLERYASYLEDTDVPIQRLAKTLNSHRSTLPVRIAFAETSKQDILEAITKQLSKVRGSPGTEIGTRSPAIEFDQNRRPRILGVFTGQGAQWPGMGQNLMKKCALFRETIEAMEQSLAQLPDPPAWSLTEELMAPPAQSRMSDAELSLPLCAAVQVGLVRLLSRAGITFHTVVGHSGGEIGAAFAVGKISATDAVRIAYYRGIVCELAVGPDGRRGGMIAVGFGYEEGINFCSTAKMQDRLTVAASNSPKSVTLAGDKDAVMEAKKILDAEGLFNRVLQVDTGYHSSHMLPCAEPYTAQLESCDIRAGPGSETTAWVSSVYDDSRTMTSDHDTDLQAAYWTDNLIGRVLFSQALERALDDGRGALDLILEVGPHPALRGPTLETMRRQLGYEVPYSGVLDRKADDITAFSNALGLVWTHLGPSCVDFSGYSSAFEESNGYIDNTPLPDLPTYPWDHKQILYRESRLNKKVRSRVDRPHELLGNRTPDDTDYEPRWRNFFKLDEMPWLRDHRIQNQIIVPAATYCVMALEAAKVIGRGKPVESIELLNISILRPIVLDESSGGTETLLSLRSDLDSSKGKRNMIRAEFSLSAGTVEDGHLRTAATGDIRISLASNEFDSSLSFPSRASSPQSELVPVNINQFYEALGEIGLGYSGSFRAITSAERRMDTASAVVAIDEEVGKSIPVHPTWLDACFQTFLAAFAAPRDGSLWTAFMPTTIGRITCAPTSSITPGVNSVTVNAQLTEFTPGFQATLPAMTGDMNIYNSSTGQLEIRIEDFTMSTFLPASEKDDKLLYMKMVWQQDILSGADFETEQRFASPYELSVVDACEQAVHYYLSRLRADKSFHEIAKQIPGLFGLVETAADRGARAPTTSEMIAILKEFGEHIDMVLVNMIGQKLLNGSQELAPAGAQAPASLGELMNRWHNQGLGFAQVHMHMVSATRQISHRYSNLRILQVGPSSASLVRSVCQELEHALNSYTIVDGSAEAIEEMQGHLNSDHLRLKFHVLDIEKGIGELEDAVAVEPFDVVIVHKAIRKQKATLKTIRSLLKPGGFLVMMAGTGNHLRFPFYLLAAPPSVNEEDASVQPKLTNANREETHTILQNAGFSGVDSIAFDNFPEKHTYSVVVSQALDGRVSFFRAPFSSTSGIHTSGKLLVLGGSSLRVANFIHLVQCKLSRVWNGVVITVESLADVGSQRIDDVEAVLSLTDLDRPVLEHLNAPAFKSLQHLLEGTKTILWVTQGARSQSPYQSGTIGLGRTFQSENPHKLLQFLDLDTLDGSESLITESFLRLIVCAATRDESSKNSHLWSIEPELAVENGRLLIPRLFLDKERNDRLNSLRRKVEIQALAGKQPVSLVRSQRNTGEIVYTAEEALQHCSDLAEIAAGSEQITLRVEFCSFDPVIPNYQEKQLFCCIGYAEEGTRFLALSASNSSFITVPRMWTIRLDDGQGKNTMTLPEFICLLSEVKARVIEKAMPAGYTTLLYEIDEHISASLERLGNKLNRKFSFINCQAEPSCAGLHINHIEIGRHTSSKEMKSVIPPRTRLLIHLGHKSDASRLSAIQQVLPANAVVASFDNLDADDLVPQEILSAASAYVKQIGPTIKKTFDSTSVVKASALVREGAKRHANVVVDWTGAQNITLTRRPADPRHLFSPNKTYLLVGLSGQIGQSICRWMVGNGARHVVVTSRNPNKRASWKDELERQGANISIEAADVTKMQDIVGLRRRILSTMPPIGGVANGAMAMGNSFFVEMNFETFQKVLKPKVDGSLILDMVFSADDLDFFILFSSISAVTGQRGQANYAAANNFMVGLASQRRARNLAASVIDIGMIIGIGYIQRTDVGEGFGAMETILRKLDYMPVSERDLHQLLTEAILVGRSDESPEIITGLETNKNTSGHSPFWHKSPLFTHVTKYFGSPRAGHGSSNSVQKTLKQKLTDSRGPDGALQIMEEALLTYLASSLKLPVESIHTNVPVIDLGIDSLIAVEIRNWIFAETSYDVPVLKILGVSSIKQICAEVVSSVSFQGRQPEAIKAQDSSPPKRRDWNELSTDKYSSGSLPKNRLSNHALISTGPTKPLPQSDLVRDDQLTSQTTRTKLLVDANSNGLRPENAPKDGTSSTNKSPGPLSQSGVNGNGHLTSPTTPIMTLGVGNRKSSPAIPLRAESLSLGQARLYLSQYLDDATVLNCTACYELSGKLDMPRLEKALEAVTQTHETLRSIFFTDEKDGQPKHGIIEKSPFKLRSIPGMSGTTHVQEVFARTHEYRYDLTTGDTFIATVLSHGHDSHTIIFGYHHIIMDGVSWQIFQEDLAKFYNDPSSVSSLKSLPNTYIDFTRKQQRDMTYGAYSQRLKFFQNEFREPVDPLPLFPFAKVSTRKSLTRYAARDVVTHVSAELVSALKKASQASRTTSFHFFLATFQVLLHRLLDTQHLCIGMVDANRSDQSFSNTIGFFLEILPVLFRIDGEQKFSDVLQTTRNKAYATLAQSGVPTVEILRACDISTSTTETPLFQVVFNYRMGASRTSPMQGVDVKFLEYADAKTPFDLVISVDELDNGAAMLTFSLQDYLYDQEGSELLANTYVHLLEALSKNTTRSVGSISIFDATLAQQAVALGTGPKMELAPPSVDTLSKIMNTWINRDPGALAVKDLRGNTKTYLQLSERASAICAALLSAGAASSSRIYVLLDPGIDTIATILAILRICTVYVPLDIRSTDERLRDILEESGSTLLLYHGATAERAEKLHRLSEITQQIKLVTLDTVPPAAQEVEDISASDGLAMLLYTSGSTGKPKGIPLTNANIRTTILGASERLQLSREVVLQQSGQGFDAAIFQIFIALVNGGTLIMGDNRNHPAELAALMEREGITCSVFIVSEMQSILRYGFQELLRCSSWRIAMVAGETFTKNLLDQFRSLNLHDLRIVNAYGPTEASICSSMHVVSLSDANTDDFSVPIGKPLANYGTYIVDHECTPVPIGWPGEIAITGSGVATEYFNLPQLTESKFKHPTSLDEALGLDRLYLTGDKGRMLSDGSIVMCGRMDGDDQVKIRGMRVQLDDISRALVQASRGSLVDAAVLLRGDDPSNQQLVAYVVFSRTSQVLDKHNYLLQLNQELPIPLYMRPVVIIPLDVLPVTERGKLDSRKLAALPLPEVSLDGEVSGQLTEHEACLRDIWRSVLGKISSSTPICRSSEFFAIGGSSLLLLPLKSEIRRAFAVDLSLPELFQASTLELQAARLAGNSNLIHIDWKKETELDDTMFASPRSVNRHATPARSTKSIAVLLTGATGFLGTAVLRQLVHLPQVARVHCAATRSNAQGGARRPSGVESPKVVYHSGDLALPNLGMNQAELDDLFTNVDVIIHNGAEVSHMKNYRSLRAANVGSTVELARLAVRHGHIPIHYISTGGVARLSGALSQPESSLAAFWPPTDGSDGYVASKWASEVILENVHKRFQGQIWIHRPSSITADDVLALDIVHSVLRYSRLMKAVPDLTGSTGAFDFIHVDTVSKAIASCVISSTLSEQRDSGSGLVYVHQSGEKVIPVNQLREYLEGSAVGSFEIWAPQEWVSGAVEKGLDKVVASFILASKGVIRAPLLQNGRRTCTVA
ncbi:putative hybrid NRPS/PKS enzyme [Pseudomassariella vexata]|uniref:Putative hybrid NRPS/PKS enzyme n=1 Tax=Pseudomassariella vexata TaxID=1141098 RepID=A0A1Y2EJQ4_9PEZI|nr:putative hybrid NRPS/PKS enzyme [Pseudomassariella vexata]ORY71799.1 putative hybrid NRPS/PKS enzyme [Pseudomassariella vexata]